MAKSKGTTAIGYVNKHGNRVLQKTDQPGNDHLQRTYVLQCPSGHDFGSNGSDLWQRKCPTCQGGAAGLAY